MNKSIEYKTNITVSFGDLDPMNIVWHGNYLRYLEYARGQFFNQLGYDYTQMQKDKIAYPIAKMELKFVAPAHFNQELEIKCILEEIEPAIIMKYIISDAKTKKILFKASSMQICINLETNTTTYNAPEKLTKIFRNKK